MYQALLTRKYLTSKIMPALAILAVALCSCMVIVVWSVMGGFLSHLVNSGRALIGDVMVEWPNQGFPYYEEFITDLEHDDLIAAAAPALQTYSLVILPNDDKRMVLVRGIDQRFAKVTDYAGSLWWRPLDQPLPKDVEKLDPRLDPKRKAEFDAMLKGGLALRRPNPVTGQPEPAAVIGIEMTGQNERHRGGYYTPYEDVLRRMPDGGVRRDTVFMPRDGSITLNLLPIDRGGKVLDLVHRKVPVANELQTGLYELDKSVLLYDLADLQRLMLMDEAQRLESQPSRGVRGGPDGERFDEPKKVGVEPARVTTVFIRGKGQNPDADALARRVSAIYETFAKRHPKEVPESYLMRPATWRDNNRFMIAAVEKETAMVLILFSIISLVAVFLILAIFWSMVAEKTKDIGILRALGASRSGVAWLWVRYGLAIGVLGAIVGGVLAFLIVSNINGIHDFIGEKLGLWVWDPRVYYFSVIPAQFKWMDSSVVLVSAVLASGLGALIPALRAARMDPVKSLRFE